MDRSFGRQLSIFAVLVFLAGATGPVRAAPRPNVVVIMTDDQARWALGCYGNRDCQTPNMDRIASDGAKFSNAFVVTPVCSPSRATFFTGRYGVELRITDWINAPEAAAGVGLPNVPTWPGLLQQAGYATGLFGKWHLGAQPQFHPTKHGFDSFVGFLGGGQEPMNPTLEINGTTQQLKGPVSDLITDHALRFVEQHREAPFALCLFFREPHQPYEPMPQQDVQPFKALDPTVPSSKVIDEQWLKDRHRAYYAAIHAADRNIGRLLDKLDELKLTENTIVLFTSDHGYQIGHHNLYTKGNAAFIAGAGVHGPKRPNMFEESIRVPLLVRWPGVTKPGSEIADTVSNLDTFATMLGMTGIVMPEGVKQHGVDFSPRLRGQSIPRREALYGDYDLHNGGFASMRMIRTDEWKLIRHQFTNGLDELYDLKNDPGEKKNLYSVGAARQKRQELTERLLTWQQSINDPTLTNPLQTPDAGGGVRAGSN